MDKPKQLWGTSTCELFKQKPKRRQNFKRKTKRGVLWGRVLKYVLFSVKLILDTKKKKRETIV